MIVSLFALGAAFIGGGGSTFASIVAIVSLMTYVASFAISLEPIFWLLNAEIYPGDDGELDLQVHRLPDLPAADRSRRRTGAFWIYGRIGVLTLWFCWKFVPETKGKHLEDIQAYFQARVAARKTSA